MTNEQYVAANSTDAFERKRIGLLRRLEDPRTIRRLEHIGVQEGWHCLEVAAGDGSIARWLADRVAPAGHVVATDVNLRFLDDCDGPNLEVRRHNILEDELERDCYDLVHCRTLLMHLQEPERAVERMVMSLRPGGWLLLEETDYVSFSAADPDHPDAVAFERTIRTILDTLLSKGVVNPYFGRRLRPLIERFELADLSHEGTTRLVRGGEPAARYQRMNFCTLVRPHLRDAEQLQERDFEALSRAFVDPSYFLIDRTTFAVWGRA